MRLCEKLKQIDKKLMRDNNSPLLKKHQKEKHNNKLRRSPRLRLNLKLRQIQLAQMLCHLLGEVSQPLVAPQDYLRSEDINLRQLDWPSLMK